MIYETSDVDGALACLRSMPADYVDLVILDATLCNDRLDAVGAIRQGGGRARVVVLGDDIAAIDQRVLAADGFLTFGITADTMFRSLSLVHKGERVVPRGLAQAVAARSQEGRGQASGGVPPSRPARSEAPSRREAEILQRLLQGQPNKTIARELGITETTVKIHLKNLLRKISASNRTQAAIWALNNGYAGYSARPGPSGADDPAKPGRTGNRGRNDSSSMGNRRGKPV